MKLTLATALLAGTTAFPVFAGGHAAGDAALGEIAFRQCRACHAIVDADGTEILKGGRNGPNLWGLPGRTAGSADFRYGEAITAAGEAGLAWDEASFLAFVKDPGAFLQEVTGDSDARSGMAFRLRKEEDAVNIWAYIASVSPEPGW